MDPRGASHRLRDAAFDLAINVAVGCFLGLVFGHAFNLTNKVAACVLGLIFDYFFEYIGMSVLWDDLQLVFGLWRLVFGA